MGASQFAEISFNAMPPARMRAMQGNLGGEAESPRSTTGIMATPGVPMPVQTA
jgi:hypothetical protein